MSSPTDQLIRDYLSRLSAAAKGRLSAEDRQALVAGTRDFIDQNVSASDLATPMEVATFLSRLGDPAALVAREISMQDAELDEATELSAPAGDERRGLRRRRSRQASWHWPLLPGSPDIQVRLLNEVRDQAEARAAQEAAQVPAGTVPASPVPAGTLAAGTFAASTGAPVADGTAGERLPAPSDQRAEPPIWVPRQPSWPEAGGQLAGVQRTGGQPSGDQPAGDPGVRPRLDPSLFELPASETSWRFARTGATFIGSAAKFARANPVEVLAVVLLGLGGAVYPPVWLLGAIFALVANKVWDYRDRWVGLAGPVLLLVVGTVAGVSLSGASHSSMASFVHEAWVYADVLSRVAAVIGATYLAVRLRRGKREPPVPPWHKPHQAG